MNKAQKQFQRKSEKLPSTKLPSKGSLELLPKGQWKSFWTKVHQLEIDLVDAADSNDVPKVDKILASPYPIDLNTNNGLNGWSALHFAAFNNNKPMIVLLIHKGANINLRSDYQSTPLHIAINNKALEAALFFLTYSSKEKKKYSLMSVKIDIDINAQDDERNSPLHLALMTQQLNITETLLKLGCNQSLKNDKGQEPIDLITDVQQSELLRKFGNEKLSAYSRVTFANQVVLKNSRFDHTQKLLDNFAKSNSQKGKGVQIDPTNLMVLEQVGRGSFGSVYKVFDRATGFVYALKAISKLILKNQDIDKYIYSEKEILQACKSKYIPKLHKTFQNSTHLFLLIDFVEGQNLSQLLEERRKLSENEAIPIIAQVASALNYLHNQGIIYRDLKPHNVMRRHDGTIQLVDFGLSKKLDSNYDPLNLAFSFCGSVAYLAPEMIRQVGHNEQLDQYLLGVLFYELLHGQPPFIDITKNRIFKNVLSGKVQFDDAVSFESKQTIKQLMNLDPQQRLSYLELKYNQLFQNLNWDKIEEEHHLNEISINQEEGEPLSQVFQSDNNNFTSTLNFFPHWDQ